MLMKKTARGLYRAATKTEVCEAAVAYQTRSLIGKQVTMGSSKATIEFLRSALGWRDSEGFAVIFLDNRNRVLDFRVLFNGTIDGANVHPREVARACIELNAAAVIFAHNHPSGVSEPSDADVSITRRLKEALALLEIRTLDHIVIGHDSASSFAERGLL